MNLEFKGIKIFKDENRNFNDEKLFFENNDYTVIKDILTDEIKDYLYNNIIYDSKTLNDKMQFYREHNDPSCTNIIIEFYETIKPFYEHILDKKLTKFIGFSMKYNENSELMPHYDNYNMPISSNICYHNLEKIDYPIYIDNAYFNNPHPFRLTINDKKSIPEKNIIKINANEGDIVIFRGRNHLHWRDKKYIKDFRALLLHTEDYTYNGKLISYIHNTNEYKKADINNVKNINTYALNFIDDYETFRTNYMMYFNNT